MNYNKKIWLNGDLITQESMNNIENGIYKAHDEIETLKNNTSSGTGITPEQAQQLNTAYTHSQSTHVQQSAIPTKTSQLTNDSNFVNDAYVTNAINNAQLGGGSSGTGSNNASDISITDTGNYFTNSDVEGALQEVGSQIKEIENEKASKADLNNNFNNLQGQVNNLVLGAVGDGNNAEIIQARTNYYGNQFSTLKSLNDNIEKSVSDMANKKFKIKWAVGQLSSGILYPNANKYRINTANIEYAEEDILFKLADYEKYKYGYQTFDSQGKFKKDSGWLYNDTFIPKGTYFMLSISPIKEETEIIDVINNELFNNITMTVLNSTNMIAQKNEYVLKKDNNFENYYKIGRTKLNLNQPVIEDYIATGDNYRNRILPKYPNFINLKGVSHIIVNNNNTNFNFAIDYIKDNIVVANTGWVNTNYKSPQNIDYDYMLIQFKKSDDSDFDSVSEFNFDNFKVMYNEYDLFALTYAYNIVRKSEQLVCEEKIAACEEKIVACEEKIVACEEKIERINSATSNISKNIIYEQSKSIGYRMTNNNDIKINEISNLENAKTIDLLLSFNPNDLNAQVEDTTLLATNNFEIKFKKNADGGKLIFESPQGNSIESKVNGNIKLIKELNVESYGASQGIATDSSYIYTSNNRLDANSYNVHKRKLDGTLVKGITLPSGFQHPCGLCVVGNILYVPANNYPTNDTTNRIYRIDTSNMEIIDYKDIYSAHGVSSITFKDNLFYIADWVIQGNTNIIVCDMNFNILYSKDFDCRRVQGLDLYKDKLIVSETENNQFIIFDFDTKEKINTYKFFQQIEGEDICITDEGTILHEDVNAIREYKLSDNNVAFKLRITMDSTGSNTIFKFYIDNILHGQTTVTGANQINGAIRINGNSSDLNKGCFNLQNFGISSNILTDYNINDYSKYDILYLYGVDSIKDINNNTIQTTSTIINQIY